MAIFEKLGKYSNFGLLIMRLGIGVVMIHHGLPKIMGGPSKWTALGENMGNVGIHFAPLFWGLMAALAESLGGLLTILGLWFRPVCIFILITMIVAIMHHYTANDSFDVASPAVVLACVYFGLLFVGPGRLSVDKG